MVVGGGIVLLASNIALGLEARYSTNLGHTVRINGGPESSGYYDTVMVALALRAVLAELGR